MPNARGADKTDVVVVRVDYKNYQQGHKGQAAKLAETADLEKRATSREFDWLAIMAINRLLVLSLQPQFEVDAGYRHNPLASVSECHVV